MPVTMKVKFQFKVRSGFHTSGDRVEMWTDKAIAKSWLRSQEPVLPATSLKGWLRDNAERILRGFGLKVCDSSQASTICGQCLICRVFGSPRQKSPLRFFDGHFEEPLLETCTNVSLSRHRKTAFEERLFTTEVVWSKTLKGDVQGVFASQKEAEEAIALLWLASKAGFAIGAMRSRGLGWLELERFESYCNGQPVGEDKLVGIVKEWSNLDARQHLKD